MEVYTMQQISCSDLDHIFTQWEERWNKCICFVGKYIEHVQNIELKCE